MAKRDVSRPEAVFTGETRSIGALDDLVSIQLRRVDLLLSRGFTNAAHGMNLRSGIISCLGLIVANPGISQKEITEQTGTDKSIIASLVDGLEEQGWARRHRSSVDQRRYELVATPEGEARLEELAVHIRKIEHSLLAEIAPHELDQLSDLLRRMHASCKSAIDKMAYR